MKSWVLDGDVLEIADGETRIAADVNQIYDSIIQSNSVWSDLLPGKHGDARQLNFLPYPVDLTLVISGDPVNEIPVLTLQAKTQDNETFAVSGSAIARGHFVHTGTWYPVARGSLKSIEGLLEEAGCNHNLCAPNTLKGLLCLKRAAADGGPVIDTLPDSTLKKLSCEKEARMPQGINAQLYHYQLDGWRWLRFIIREQVGGLLADEMGLGKTLQVISALHDSGEEEREGSALVIAPGSLLENWVREISKFCPKLRTLKHQGRKRTGSPADLQNFDVVIASYDTVVSDLSLIKMVPWGVVILDEAQNIRNPDALRTKSIKQIGRKVGLAVTGTPVENRLRDLWSIMDFAVPGHLGNLRDFELRYEAAEDEINAAARLEPLVSPLMLRRRIADVATDLPERITIPEILELNDAEAKIYDELRAAIFKKYGAGATFVSLVRLQQFCAHPSIIEDGRYAMSSEFSKFERTQELLEEIFLRDEKALIFTSYKKMADLLTKMASRKFGVMSATFDGRLALEHRQPLIDRFTQHDGPAVLVLNSATGGTGLNITAANHVIHYNPEWNPAREDQASGRAHRRGQERPVTVRNLICAGTVEEIIYDRLKRKRNIADAVIVGVGGQNEDYADIIAALQCSPFSGRQNNYG